MKRQEKPTVIQYSPTESIASRGVLSVENSRSKNTRYIYIYILFIEARNSKSLLKGLIGRATTTTRYYLITERNARSINYMVE
jgi:hypothetical protein